MTNKITLGEGVICIVSPEDHHWISQRSWYLDANGYVRCDLFGGRKPSGVKSVLLHRLILLAPDSATVDHINRNPLDNRRENLRLATMSQQNANKPKHYGKSNYKGVYRRRDGRKWCAQIRVNRVMNYLGSFETQEEAARAYNAAAVSNFGEFAYLNPITEE